MPTSEARRGGRTGEGAPGEEPDEGGGDRRVRRSSDEHERPVDREAERWHGGSGAGGERDQVDDERGEDGGQHDPAEQSGRTEHERAPVDQGTQPGRPDALGLQVEELVGVVPQVGQDGQGEPDEREHERDQRRAAENEHGATRERLRSQLRLELLP